MLKLDYLLAGAKIKECKNDKLMLVSGPNYTQPNKDYVLEQYKGMIRVKGVKGGHMPLLNDVKQIEMNYHDNIFQMKARLKYRRTYEYVNKI
ncbi:hypothetical protein RD055328_09120 [Companilactobacillus sp. RD055328]|nr:hypothetical protein RD055328_09120 [Companilactobacillus sp. RD055328]